MKWRVLGVVFLGTIELVELQAAQAQSSSLAPPAPAVQYRAVLNKYCVTCHNEKLKTANLMLDKLDVGNVPAGAETWEKVIGKLRGDAMPPPGLPRPDKATYDSLAAYLETALDRYALAHPNPGRPTIHRLNRAEYANSVRDILAVNVDPGTLLPADDSGYGFDNIGDVLSISPLLLERYLSASRTVVRLAMGDPAMRPAVETYDVPDGIVQEGRMSEDLPLGSRAGMVVNHYFPADGEYVIKVRMKGEGIEDGGDVRRLALKRQVDLLLDEQRVRLFALGNEKVAPPRAAYLRPDLETDGPIKEEVPLPLEVRIPVKAGQHAIGVAFFVEDSSEPEGVLHTKGRPERQRGAAREPVVKGVTVEGPFDAKGLGSSPSRQKIFVCYPEGKDAAKPVQLAAYQAGQGNDEDSCARKILSTLAHRAFRRPVTGTELEALLRTYRTARSKGSFEDGIRMAVERVLVSPMFLFRLERDPPNADPGTVFRISDPELATRLSFFLWSSTPDDQLLDLAERERLKDPVVLEQQVKRLLRDPRSKEMVRNFAGQWLQLRRLANLSPDPLEFPAFDESLREDFARETELFMESMVREDRPLMDLLGAKYTFLNERLAKHYGVPNVYSNSFQRVTLTDQNRQGLLGQGSILALTSYPTRTSVVLRGVWLLTNILGTPPPAPPPNVPALKDRGADGKVKSVREAMEEHRANPVCATCHTRMDPLGFALENFDAIGKWRTVEGSAKTPIDSSGTLPDGTAIKGPADLRKVLMSKPDQFAGAVTERLLTYALGRGVEYYDEPAVRKIRRDAAPDERWSSLIMGIAKSEPFNMRRTREQ
jgi:mono/diheme cytochrome c family protein